MAEEATPAAPQGSGAITASVPAPGASITDLILILTGEGDAKVRQAAALDILRQGSEEGNKALFSVLERTNDISAKQAICLAIAQVPPPNPVFVERLGEFLTDEADPVLRDAAVTALAGSQDPAVVQKLQRFYQRQEVKLLTQACVERSKELYGLLPSEGRVAKLQRWLKSTMPLDRLIALEIIHEAMLGTPPTPPAEGVLAQIRQMLTDSDESVRLNLIVVLRDLAAKEDAAGLLAMLPNEKSAAVREEIYRALGRMGHPNAVSACINGLNDASDKVAAAAAAALGRLLQKGNGERPKDITAAVGALVVRAGRPIAGADVREQVVQAMADIADEKFLPMLVAHAGEGEKEPRIRQAAILGVGRMAGGVAQIWLVQDRLTKDPDAGVREAAAGAMGTLGSTVEHLDILRSRLDAKVEPAAAVRKAAWESCRQVFLKLAPKEQQAILDGWGSSDKVLAGQLVDLLTDLEKQLSGVDPVRTARVREQLGDGYVVQGQPALAAGAFARALEVLAGSEVEDRARVSAKLVDAYLKVPDLAKALAAAVESSRTPGIADAVAAVLLQYAQETARKDSGKALVFIDQLAAKVPGLFGPGWKTQFEALRRTLPLATTPAETSAAGG